jgi:hypothetical protein
VGSAKAAEGVAAAGVHADFQAVHEELDGFDTIVGVGSHCGEIERHSFDDGLLRGRRSELDRRRQVRSYGVQAHAVEHRRRRDVRPSRPGESNVEGFR